MLGAFDHLGPTNQMITANHTALLRRQQPATSIQRFNQLWKRYKSRILDVAGAACGHPEAGTLKSAQEGLTGDLLSDPSTERHLVRRAVGILATLTILRTPPGAGSLSVSHPEAFDIRLLLSSARNSSSLTGAFKTRSCSKSENRPVRASISALYASSKTKSLRSFVASVNKPSTLQTYLRFYRPLSTKGCL
jgi:hypothetical protein